MQDTLQQALKAFTNEPCVAVAAGRTDTGVHALQQVVHLDTRAQRSQQSWIRGLNAWLPDTVSVQWARTVAPDFHARFSAQARTYVYVLRHHPVASPFTTRYTGWVYRPLCLASMRAAAHYLLGRHDFSCFRSSQCQAAHPVRTLHQLEITEKAPYFLFLFRADAFLHHMVRNLMGALVQVGRGKQPPEWVRQLVQQRDRRLSAPTFSANGLYLADVSYDSAWGLPAMPWPQRLYQLTGMAPFEQDL